MKRLDLQHPDASVLKPNTETTELLLGEGCLRSAKSKKWASSTSRIRSLKSRQISMRKSRSKPAMKKLHGELESCHPALANSPSPPPCFSTDASCNKENALPNSQRSLPHIIILKHDWLRQVQKPVALTPSDHYAGHLAAPCNHNLYQHHQIPGNMEIRTPQPQTPICLGNLKLLSDAPGEDSYLDAYALTQEVGEEGYSHLGVRTNSQNTSPIYVSSRTRLLNPTLEALSFRDKSVLPPTSAPSYPHYFLHEHETEHPCHGYAGSCSNGHQYPTEVSPIRMCASDPAIYPGQTESEHTTTIGKSLTNIEVQRSPLTRARSFGNNSVERRKYMSIYAPERFDTAVRDLPSS